MSRGNKKRGQQDVRRYFVILGAIAVLLIFITAFLDMNNHDKMPVGEKAGQISEREPQGNEELPEVDQEKPSEKELPGIEVPLDVMKSPVEKPVGYKGALVFVIDDVGNSLDELELFLKIPGPVVFAVMPKRRYTEECIRRIKAAGKSVIIHQPMEPVGDADPGKGAIFSNMSEDEIHRILDENIESTGLLTGINNHMGSRVTIDPVAMRIIMKYLKEKDMFFLDSATNINLVGKDIAREIGVPYLKRNSMFLDNDSDRESVLAAIKEGQNTAVKKGHAVMIGHVMTESLAELLIELYPTFMEDGFTIKDFSDLLHGEYDVSTWD